MYTILIVDDDEATHEVLGLYLSRAGCRVLRAEHGGEGLALMRSAAPDLVLLDIQMPELDGFQTLEQARRDPAISGIPVIFLTSLDRQNLKVKGLELGADDYIVKPFHSGETLARVKAALRRSARYQRVDGRMEGDLGSFGLAELLQTMELGRKSALLRLPDMAGACYLEGGTVVRVEQGRFIGRHALERLILLERGRFEVHFGPIPEELERDSASLGALLLDTLTCVDEARLLAGSHRHSVVEDDGGVAGGALAKLLPLPFEECLCLMDGGVKENAQLLAEGVAAGRVRLASAE